MTKICEAVEAHLPDDGKWMPPEAEHRVQELRKAHDRSPATSDSPPRWQCGWFQRRRPFFLHGLGTDLGTGPQLLSTIPAISVACPEMMADAHSDDEPFRAPPGEKFHRARSSLSSGLSGPLIFP